MLEPGLWTPNIILKKKRKINDIGKGAQYY